MAKRKLRKNGSLVLTDKSSFPDRFKNYPYREQMVDYAIKVIPNKDANRGGEFEVVATSVSGQMYGDCGKLVVTSDGRKFSENGGIRSSNEECWGD